MSNRMFILAGLLALGACSSTARYTIDDVVLSDVPLSRKGDMLAAQGEMNRALEEKNKAQADLAIDERDLSVANSERDQIRLDGKKVGADIRLAERGQDLNRIDAARGGNGQLNQALATSQAKIDWLTARRDGHRALVQVAELHQLAAERRYELEKARLVQATGKRPSRSFNVANFEEQDRQAQRQYSEARARADRQGAEAAQREQAYLQRARPTS